MTDLNLKSQKLSTILVNYNFTPTWLLTSDLDYHIFDRSESKEWLKDFPQERITYTENKGNVDYDKLAYLIDNYDNLPDVFLWGKTNLFKYISEEEFEKVKNNKTFTPLLTQNHKVYSDRNGVVCYYSGGIYHERNDSWFLHEVPGRIESWNAWAQGLQLPQPMYIPFAPGGNYILTRETVHRYSVDYYKKIFDSLGYTTLPGEAQCAERSYYLMWA
jgi:hypothetical protein